MPNFVTDKMSTQWEHSIANKQYYKEDSKVITIPQLGFFLQL
jgi:hypothetical protein